MAKVNLDQTRLIHVSESYTLPECTNKPGWQNNSGHKKVGLLNEKMIKEKLMKEAYNYMVWLRKQQNTYESN